MSEAPYSSLQEDEKESDASFASPQSYHSTIVASSPAVQCRRLCRSYGSTRILHSLNLTVPTGAIYALLGPSGCGKVEARTHIRAVPLLHVSAYQCTQLSPLSHAAVVRSS